MHLVRHQGGELRLSRHRRQKLSPHLRSHRHHPARHLRPAVPERHHRRHVRHFVVPAFRALCHQRRWVRDFPGAHPGARDDDFVQSPQAYALVAGFCGDAPFIGIGAIPTNWHSFSNGFAQYEVPIDYQMVCEYYFQPIAIVETGVASPEAGALPPMRTPASTGDESAKRRRVRRQPPPLRNRLPAPAATTAPRRAVRAVRVEARARTRDRLPECRTEPAIGNATRQPPWPWSRTAARPGYDLYSADMAPSGDCPDPAIGIDFTMTGPAGSAHQATSNAGGELS